MQTITTCWHGEVWWFHVHLATNITFIVFFLTSSLHPLSPGIFTVYGSFHFALPWQYRQTDLLPHHSAIIYNCGVLCMTYYLVWFTSWRAGNLTHCFAKKKRGLVYATQSDGPQQTSRIVTSSRYPPFYTAKRTSSHDFTKKMSGYLGGWIVITEKHMMDCFEIGDHKASRL